MDQEITLRIVVESPPEGVAFGLQKGSGNNYETVQRQQSMSEDLSFEFTTRLKREKDVPPNFLGSFVQGPKKDRFVYIDIGTYAGQADTIWSRRLKVPLKGITWEMIHQITGDPSLTLETFVPGTGKDGGPNCGTVKPFDGWHLSSMDKRSIM